MYGSLGFNDFVALRIEPKWNQNKRLSNIAFMWMSCPKNIRADFAFYSTGVNARPFLIWTKFHSAVHNNGCPKRKTKKMSKRQLHVVWQGNKDETGGEALLGFKTVLSRDVAAEQRTHIFHPIYLNFVLRRPAECATTRQPVTHLIW